MNSETTKIIAVILLVVHGFLGLWAIVGFIEWFSASTPWPRVSNDLFPRDILFMQWTLILIAAVVFIAGCALDWRYTPGAMACVYAAMAALCAVETFGYMKGSFRFAAMALEYIAYAAILLFLFRSDLFRPVHTIG